MSTLSKHFPPKIYHTNCTLYHTNTVSLHSCLPTQLHQHYYFAGSPFLHHYFAGPPFLHLQGLKEMAVITVQIPAKTLTHMRIRTYVHAYIAAGRARGKSYAQRMRVLDPLYRTGSLFIYVLIAQ